MAYENTLEYIVNKVWERYRLYDGSEDNTMKERQMILRSVKLSFILDFEHDLEQFKKDAKLMALEYFNYHQELYDTDNDDTFDTLYDIFNSDSHDYLYIVFFKDKDRDYLTSWIKNIIDEHEFEYQDHYDYTDTLKLYEENNNVRRVYTYLHPDIDAELENMQKFKQTVKLRDVFVRSEITSPLEFYIYMRFIANGTFSKDILASLGGYKLTLIKEKNPQVYNEIMSFMLKYFYITYSTNNMYYDNTERFNRIKMVDVDKVYYKELYDFLTYDVRGFKDVLKGEEFLSDYRNLLVQCLIDYTPGKYDKYLSEMQDKEKEMLKKLEITKKY